MDTYLHVLRKAAFILLSTLLLSSCLTSAVNISSTPPFAAQTPAPGKALLYVFYAKYWQENIREYELQLLVDDEIIGTIGTSDYYLLELWPGDYDIAVELLPYTALGKRRQGGEMATKGISIDAGEINLLGMGYVDASSNPLNFYTAWPFKAGALEGRTLTRQVPHTETAQAIKTYGGQWQGPARKLLAHGEGTLRLPNGMTYQGRMERGDYTTDGVLIYPDGKRYKGEYSSYFGKPEGKGLLTDADGNVVFAGTFYDGKPYEKGVSSRNGQLHYEDYGRYGTKQETDPATLAEQSITNQDKRRLASISKEAEPFNAEVSRYQRMQRDAREEFEEKEASYPSQCTCAFKLCLESNPSDESLEERRARKKAQSRRDAACREWRATGGTYAERKAQLDRELANISGNLADALAQLKQAEQRDAAVRKQKAAALARTRAARTAELEQKIRQQQRDNLEEQRLACQGKETYCSCYAFRPPSQTSGSLTCTQ